MKFIIKKFFINILSVAFLLTPYDLKSLENGVNDFGIITLMYHRFEENKYPSTNIKIKEFKNHLNLIKEKDLKFINPKNFENEIKNKQQRKILLTIDDGFLSFYDKAWPILKELKTPFILFVSTREVGKRGYMSWDQIKEISRYDFVEIGNHSHTHEYLIDLTNKEILNDLQISKLIFKEKLGVNSNFFSYPFGEYSLSFKKIVQDLGFKYAFGQHSGVVDYTKDFHEMPRFPINEKYGELERFKTILNTLPFQYKSIEPKERYINDLTNPPNIIINFHENLKNINNINCFSNENNKWRKSKIEFLSNYSIKINLEGKFTTERGRVNCSLRENNNFYRWLGVQFVVKEK